MRTTIDIDDPILKEVKSLRKERRTSLGRIVSDLLAIGLRTRTKTRRGRRPPNWIARAMTARLDLVDKDALYAAMERETSVRRPPRR